MSEILHVRWKQLVVLDADWELSVLDSVSAVAADGLVNFVEDTEDTSAHLCILAYPASAHADVVEARMVATALAGFPGSADRRVALAACSPSEPEVTQEELDMVLRLQAPGTGDRHSCRPLTPRDLEAAAQVWLKVAMRRAGISSLQSQVDQYSSDGMLNVDEKGRGPWPML